MQVADVRVILADIPVKRPHAMSFTTLKAVNFAFVRLETADGAVGWGEAACLGGPTWSEESAESVAATIERYIAPWLVGRDATLIEALRQEMAHRLPALERARIAGGCAGLRPLTPDDHAIIGPAPGVEGFFLAVGFGGHGFQHAPATGRLVAEWLTDGKASMDLSLFDPARFEGTAPGLPGEGDPAGHDGPDAE